MAREIPWLALRNGVYNVFFYKSPTAEALAKNPKAKGTTKRLGLRTRDPVQAQARYAEVLRNGASVFSPNQDGLSVFAALDDYFKEHVKKQDSKGRYLVSDPERIEHSIRHLKTFFGPKRTLSSIDIPACEAYANARRKGEVSSARIRHGARLAADATIIKEISTLQAAARHALRWKRIKQGEMPTFAKPKIHDDGQEPAWFTLAELAAIYSELDRRIDAAIEEGDTSKATSAQRLRDWVEITYAWGARRGSTQTMRVEQVNLETSRVNLQKAGQRATKKRRPIVPIYPSTRPTLERLVKNAEDGFLFGPSIDFYRRFTALCANKNVGLADKAWPHVLRHSRATHMLMAGENPYKVAKLLGDNLATVLRVYAHHCPDFLDESADV